MSRGGTPRPAPLAYDVSVDGVATLRLSRPDKRNALSRELVAALAEGLERAAREGSVRVVAIRATGPDFCAGADLDELERVADQGPEESLKDAQRLGALYTALRRHPKPVVAVVHGRALGGGCGLATACDVVLVHEGAELGYPEVHLGFVPAMVMAILRRRVGEARAFELAVLGSRIDAVEAERIGLATRVLTAGHFEDEVREYLAELANRPASAVSLTKRLLYGLDGTGFDEGIARGAEVNALARLTDACRDGVRRFLDRSKG